ncbi:MAG: hypothetical protein Q8Q60_03340 [Candidatus Chromulinivorax sp.]|nr:hypothetical protein [Candidatus Chromulinivorax sp.]
MQRKIKHRIYVSTFSVITFLFFFVLTHVNPPCKQLYQQSTITIKHETHLI